MSRHFTAKMLRFFVIYSSFFILFATSIYVVDPGPRFPPTKGEVWPKPQQEQKYDKYYKLISSSLKLTVKDQTCDILKKAIHRYTNTIRTLHHIARRHSKRLHNNLTSPAAGFADENFKGSFGELEVYLSSPCEEYPYLDMDETYNLTISSRSKLNSASIWGILRGLETFSQLFYLSNNYAEVFINATYIVDFPQYAHRGLLLDTSRHYLSVANILRNLDAMEMNKMNVLHWHIVDDQSFPYQSKKFPLLSDLGAYYPTMIYTKTNINLVINYARDRGIRVIPEFDVPGHTRSWGVAYPSVLTKCFQFGELIGLGPMDPTNNATYKLLESLFQEVQERFPDKYFHVGGDEVELKCWESNLEIVEYMRTHNMTSAAELHAHFMRNVIPLLGDRSKVIVWQEVFDEEVPLSNSTLIQVWKGGEVEEMVRILTAGHKLIFSSSWYLDHLQTGGDWEDYYAADPRQMIPRFHKELNLQNIVGGEACMWGEVVDDRNVMSRVWPRTSAVAEKLWSAPLSRYQMYYNTVSDIVRRRLEEHTCRMNRRGVQAQPPNGPGFCIAQ